MLLGTFTKDPSDTIDYDVKYGSWLNNFNPKDSLYSVEASLSGTGDGELIVLSCTINGDDIKLWVTGGIAGKVYTVKIKIVTVQNRQLKYTVKFKVVSR